MNINTFYQSIYKYGDLLNVNTKKAIETFFNRQIKIDTKSSVSKNMIEFYRSYEDFMIRFRTLLS